MFLSAGTFISCDEIEAPYKRQQDNGGSDNGGDDTAQVVQKVLVEEFTGHKCPNCPSAHHRLENLKDEYGDSLVIVTIHAGFFAEPSSSGDYTADFRTDVGEVLNSAYDISNYPSGMINRGRDQEVTILNHETWNSAIAQQMGQEAVATIGIDYQYNEDTRLLSADFDIKFLQETEGPVMLSAYVTEDKILSPQKNNNENIGPKPDILDYEHNHVLRGSFNGTWGETVADDAIEADSQYTFSNQGFDVKEDWNAANIAIVAFLYKHSGGVIQAEKIIVE